MNRQKHLNFYLFGLDLLFCRQCQGLISSMLCRDPAKRATLDQVKSVNHCLCSCLSLTLGFWVLQSKPHSIRWKAFLKHKADKGSPFNTTLALYLYAVLERREMLLDVRCLHCCWKFCLKLSFLCEANHLLQFQIPLMNSFSLNYSTKLNKTWNYPFKLSNNKQSFKFSLFDFKLRSFRPSLVS